MKCFLFFRIASETAGRWFSSPLLTTNPALNSWKNSSSALISEKNKILMGFLQRPISNLTIINLRMIRIRSGHWGGCWLFPFEFLLIFEGPFLIQEKKCGSRRKKTFRSIFHNARPIHLKIMGFGQSGNRWFAKRGKIFNFEPKRWCKHLTADLNVLLTGFCKELFSIKRGIGNSKLIASILSGRSWTGDKGVMKWKESQSASRPKWWELSVWHFWF